MKITRNGQEIELTAEELSAAYREQEHLYDISYVGYVLDECVGYEEVMTEEQISNLAHEFRRRRDEYDYDRIGEIECEIVHDAFEALLGQWVLADDDCKQMVRRTDVFVFELYQIVEFPDGTLGVVHDIIDITEAMDYDDAVQDYLEVFGYKSFEELKDEYRDSWTQIFAENVFEITSLTYEPMFSGTFEECAEFIHTKTGR